MRHLPHTLLEPAALLLLSASPQACAGLTHADDFEVAALAPDDRVCAACASRPDLRHPPCGPSSSSTGQDRVAVFAMRALDLGIRASGWSAGYLVGFDQDCSDRPNALPASCTPRTTQGWVSLDQGVDNALATQVFFPLREVSGSDVQPRVNASLEAGGGSLLLILDSWNGELDDSQVGVRLVAGTRVVNGDGRTRPSWQGDDEWEVYADRGDPGVPEGTVPDARAKSMNAYVSGGVLVWDARAIQPFQALFTVGNANVEFGLENVVVFGEIATYETPQKLINTVLGGVWSAFLASRNAISLAQIATDCDACAAQDASPILETLLKAAPDMLLPASKAGGCDAISVGFLGSYVEVLRVASIVPMGSIPPSCQGAPRCER